MSSSLSPHCATGHRANGMCVESETTVFIMGQKNLIDHGYRHRLLQSSRPKNTSCKSITGSGIYFYSESFDGSFSISNDIANR